MPHFVTRRAFLILIDLKFGIFYINLNLNDTTESSPGLALSPVWRLSTYAIRTQTFERSFQLYFMTNLVVQRYFIIMKVRTPWESLDFSDSWVSCFEKAIIRWQRFTNKQNLDTYFKITHLSMFIFSADQMNISERFWTFTDFNRSTIEQWY